MSPSSSPTNSGWRAGAGKSQVAIRRLTAVASAGVAALLLATTAASAAASVTPNLYADSSPATMVGRAIFDHTNLMGGNSPTGTLSFKLYAPGDTTCQTPVFSSTVTVSGTGSDNSPSYTTPAAGTYNWTAAYSGDANNNPVSTPCGSASQAVIVGQATPVVSTTAALSGSAIHATTTLQWGFAPLGGTITFTVTGPNDQFCSGTPVYTQTVPVNGAGTYDSGWYTPTVAGTYTYRIRYSGDTNNYGVGPTACTAQGDSIAITQAQLAPPPVSPPPVTPPPVTPPPVTPPPVTPPPVTPPPAVNKVTPSFYTDSSPSTLVGRATFDHTNLMGGDSPTGTISFAHYAPGDTTCQTPVFSSTVTVSGTGSDNSPSYTTPAAGTYNWIAAYSGDANNNPVATACGTASQAVIVSPATPVVSTTAALSGSAIHATAALQWGFGSLGGTITFTVTGPNDQFCSGTPVYTQTIPVNGDGNYDSGLYTPTVAGTYTYRIRYSGDTNNYGVGPTPCTAQGDSIAITQAQLAAPTT